MRLVRSVYQRWVALRDAPVRGTAARHPWEIPLAGWLDVLARTRRKTFEEHLTLLASGIAYHAFLTVVPTILSIALIYGMIATPAQVAHDMAALIDIVPNGGNRFCPGSSRMGWGHATATSSARPRRCC